MSTNTVANFAIKLGIDPSSIPADLRNVTVNLTTEQKRLAADMKRESAGMAAEYTRRKSEQRSIDAAAATEQKHAAKASADAQVAEERRIAVAAKETAAEQKRVAAEALATQMHLGAEMNAYWNYLEKEKRTQAAATASEQKRLAADAAATQMRLGAEMNAYTIWAEREKRIQAAETAAVQKREATEAAAAQMHLGSEMNAYANWVEREKRIQAAETAAAQRRASMATVAGQRALAAEMKATSQSGVTSFRLLSESMDLGLSRPLTRFLTQSFPALSSALSGLIGVGAGGALAYFGVEAFDRVTKKLDEAKQKEEAYSEAVRKTSLVLAESEAASVKRTTEINAKMAALTGNKKAEAGFKVQLADIESVDRMAQAVDKLTEAEVREARALAERSPRLAALGQDLRQLWGSLTGGSNLQVEAITDDMERIGHTFKDLSIQDEIHGTTRAQKFLNDEFERTNHLLEIMQANQGKIVQITPVGQNPDAFGRGRDLSTPPAVLAAMEAQKRYLQDQKDAAKQIKDERDAQEKLANAEKSKDLGQRRADQMREELAAIDHLAASLHNKAIAEAAAAAATGMATEESIRAKGEALAAKDIADFVAEADTKYVVGTNQKISATREFQQRLASLAPALREDALAFASSEALKDYNRTMEEFSNRLREETALLEADAAGHGKVAAKQLEEMKGLDALKTKYEGLREAYEAKTPGMTLEKVLGAKASYDVGKTDVEALQTKTQAKAIADQLKKVKEELAAAGDASPWDKTEAKFRDVKRELEAILQPSEELKQHIAEIGAAMHAKDAVDELDKMKEKIDEAQAATASFASLSPLAKIEAEVLKLKDAYHLLPDAVNAYRNALVALQAAENQNKAFEAVGNLSASGGKVKELQEQLAALNRVQSSGKTDDGKQLSASDLAAVKLEMQQITDEIDKIVVKTGDAKAGFKAWADSLMQVESEGQFVLGMMTTVTKGAEDNAAKSVVAIIENYRHGHRRLIKELASMWEHYFAGLTEMAIKHSMDKVLAGALAGLKPKAKTPAAPDVSNLPANTRGNPWDVLFGSGAKGKDNGGASLSAAGAKLSAAAAQLSAAAMKLGGSGSLPIPIPGGGAGGSGGFGDAANFNGNIAMFAGGGDAAPGSSFISGEAGAERVDMTSRGGAHITPLGGSGAGGDTHNHYDMRGAVVTEDLLRKAEAAHMMTASENRSVARSVSMSQDIGRRSRPSR